MNKLACLKKYLLNCFLLMVPVMAWNIFLTDKLPAAFQPEVFWKDIRPFITIAENVFRVIVFLLTALMPLSLATSRQRAGFILYLTGLTAYCVSWLALIYWPDSSWSSSVWGFMAPAYIPVLWLTGIALMGNNFYFAVSYRRWYFLVPVVCFLIFHNLHTWIIFNRIH